MKNKFLPDLQEATFHMIQIAELGDGDPRFFGDSGECVPLTNGIDLFTGGCRLYLVNDFFDFG